MRISEKKRQLRDQAGSPAAIAERAQARVQSVPAISAAERGTTVKAAPRTRASSATRSRQSAAPRQARARKQRGARFYAGFGIVGLFFSILLLSTTVSNYNSEKDKYPTKLRQYTAAYAQYKVNDAQYIKARPAVTQYQAAVKNHVKPLPKAPANLTAKAPVKPAAPIKPELNVVSFALPILYGLLSIAYLYLAWRAAKISARANAPLAPTR